MTNTTQVLRDRTDRQSLKFAHVAPYHWMVTAPLIGFVVSYLMFSH